MKDEYDLISITLEGTVQDEPTRQKNNIVFHAVNQRGKHRCVFRVIIMNDDRPIDINEGDRVMIVNAGFMENKEKENTAVVTGNSTVKVIRKRCNNGIKKV